MIIYITLNIFFPLFQENDAYLAGSDRGKMFLEFVIFFLTMDKFDAISNDSETSNSTTPAIDLNFTTSAPNVSKCSDYYTLDEVRSYVFVPTFAEWFFISLQALTFVVGLIGNALVCVAVYKNHTMRNVTNYFIVV